MRARILRFMRGRGLVFVPWLAIAASGSFGAALADRSDPFRTSVSVALWVGWAAVLVLLVAPGAAALVVSRSVVTASLPAALWAADSAGWGGAQVAAVIAAAVAAIAVLAPTVGEQFVDAASYGDENRRMLRAPAPVLVGPLLPTWAVTIAGAVAGPLLLADRRWLAGSVLSALGIPVVWLGFRALLRLARRWLVFVPAGVVVHDHVALSEPILVPRRTIAAFGPARADSTATDLTGRAAGLALEMRLREPIRLSPRTGRTTAGDETTGAILVTPTRPAAVLAEAASRRFPIG